MKALIFPDHQPAKAARRDLRDKDGRTCYDLINTGTKGGASVAVLMGGGPAAAFTPPQSGTSSPSYSGRDGASAGVGFPPARLYPPVPGMGPPSSPPLPQQHQNIFGSSASVPASAGPSAGIAPRAGSEPNFAPQPSAPPGYYPPPQSYSWQGPPGHQQQAAYQQAPSIGSFLPPQVQPPQQRPQQQQQAPREDPDGGWGREASDDDWGSGAAQPGAGPSARMPSAASAAAFGARLPPPPPQQQQQQWQQQPVHPQHPEGDEPPSIFICPITADIMVDPVFAADG